MTAHNPLEPEPSEPGTSPPASAAQAGRAAEGEVPTDAEVEEALRELAHLTECRCEAAWTQRGLHAPQCASEYRVDVDTVTRARSRRSGGTRSGEGLDYRLTVQRLTAEQGWTPLTLGVLARAYLDDLAADGAPAGFLTFLLVVQASENS